MTEKAIRQEMTDLLQGWRTDLSKVPLGKPYLVYLAEEATGTRVHVAIDIRAGNGGYIKIVGGHFSYDMPMILLWHEMVPLPAPKKTS